MPNQQDSPLRAGDRHYRAFVGPPERFDLLAASQFHLLTSLGLREYHSLLDIGCGACRAGRLFLPYLLPGKYFGVEPERWLVEEGLANEVGEDISRVKRPQFLFRDDFRLTAFGEQFDFLLAQSVLSHTSREQTRRCLAEARQVMKPQAIFAANFKLGPETTAQDAWVYPLCVRYTWADFEQLVREAGLACRPLEWPHPGLSWVAIVHPGQEHVVPDVGRPGSKLQFGSAAPSFLARVRQQLANWLRKDSPHGRRDTNKAGQEAPDGQSVRF